MRRIERGIGPLATGAEVHHTHQRFTFLLIIVPLVGMPTALIRLSLDEDLAGDLRSR